jgi:hypothetical protein
MMFWARIVHASGSLIIASTSFRWRTCNHWKNVDWMWRCADPGLTDVSEERIASILRAEKSASGEPASSGRLNQDLHSATSQKTAFFIVPAVKTSNITCNHLPTHPFLLQDIYIPIYLCSGSRIHVVPSTHSHSRPPTLYNNPLFTNSRSLAKPGNYLTTRLVEFKVIIHITNNKSLIF